MSQSLTLAMLQMTSSRDYLTNQTWIVNQFEQLFSQNKQIDVVILPECGFAFGHSMAPKDVMAQFDAAKRCFADLAKRYGVTLIAGSITAPTQTEKFANRCLVFNGDGEQIGQYDKAHLFDANVADNIGGYRESEHFVAGNKSEIIEVKGVKLGLSICVDVRYPHLYQTLRQRGATVLVVMAAFTVPTGQLHWHTLLRARAIEQQCYVVACGQVGQHDNGKQTYGHSLVVNPLGEIVDELPQQRGWLCSTILQSEIESVRQSMCLSEALLD